MNHYIISYSVQEFHINGILIPKKVYTAEEKAKGKNEVTVVSEDDLKSLRSNKIFTSLEAAKKLRVMDKQPAWSVTGVEREAALQARIKELEAKKPNAKVVELESALTAAKAETENVMTEAEKVIKALREENEALKAKG